jgi:hypothetical protein
MPEIRASGNCAHTNFALAVNRRASNLLRPWCMNSRRRRSQVLNVVLTASRKQKFLLNMENMELDIERCLLISAEEEQ